jgi:drug/metabolite transporter (DMT)-like permease
VGLRIAGALAVVYLVWGSTYLGIAVAIETLPPLLMTAVRFLTAGAILYVVASRAGERTADSPGRRQWAAAAVTGVPLFLVGNGGVVWAQQSVPSGIAALLIATVPLWIAVLDRVVYRRSLSAQALVGLTLGFGGLALLVEPSGSDRIDPVGAGVLAVAALGWALGSLLSRTATLPARPLVAAAMQMLAGGAALALVAVATGELSQIRLEEFSSRSLLAFVYLILFGSVLAFSAYAWLLRVARTSLVATYAYVNPVVAVALGWAVLGEAITGRTLLAGGIIVGAVALIVSAPARRRAHARSTGPTPRRSGDRSHAEAATRGT